MRVVQIIMLNLVLFSLNIYAMETVLESVCGPASRASALPSCCGQAFGSCVDKVFDYKPIKKLSKEELEERETTACWASGMGGLVGEVGGSSIGYVIAVLCGWNPSAMTACMIGCCVSGLCVGAAPGELYRGYVQAEMQRVSLGYEMSRH